MGGSILGVHGNLTVMGFLYPNRVAAMVQMYLVQNLPSCAFEMHTAGNMPTAAECS